MSPSMLALQRKNVATLLQTMAVVTQTRVAEYAAISETTLSRMRDPKGTGDDARSEIERFCAVLAALNLVLVPRTFTSIDPDKLRALKVLARDALAEDAHESETGQA